MKRLLALVSVIVLPGLFATAQEPAKTDAPAKKPGAPFFERCDLNKDGKVDWDEFQKVRSGFAALDVDRDGAITEADMAKVAERHQQRMQEAMQRRMRRGGFGPGGGPWWGGGRRGGGPWWGEGRRGFGRRAGMGGMGFGPLGPGQPPR